MSLLVPIHFKAPVGPGCIPSSPLPDSAIVPEKEWCSDMEPPWHLDIEKENFKVPGRC